jgi:two-component system, NtrC family, sensor kinase
MVAGEMERGPARQNDTERDLRERVKELECLYEVSRAVRRAEEGLPEVFTAIVDILPRGFQYREHAGARIRMGGICRQSRGFVESAFHLAATIAAGTPGQVEVSYPPSIASTDPEPFLAEEKMMIEKIAAEISLAVNKVRAAEDNTRLEGQLRHADRLATIGALAAGITHELNEPLSRILGFAQLVQKNPGLPPAALRDVSRIVDASLHAREIVQKLLALGHGATAQVVDCDMNTITAGVLEFLEPRCRAAGIEVRRELSREKLVVMADPTEIRQVIVNLVVNALQAMSVGGRLTVRVEEKEQSCILTVEDTGVGMTPEVMDRIFIPFFTTKDEGRGTGLGLPVIHGILTSRGGSISVRSRVGAGSTFTVRLPLSPAALSEEGAQ